jgi:prephenate dehydratase
MSDTKALEKYLAISLHTTAWDEMSLLQQALLNDQAAAELAKLVKANEQLKDESLAFHVITQLRAALEKKETLIVKLKNTLVMDNNNRPAHLWDLLSALDEARLLIAFLAGYMSVSSGAVEKSKHDEAIAWLSTNKSQGDSDVSS